MFTKYFSQQTVSLRQTLSASLKKKVPARKTSSQKDVANHNYDAFYSFIREHISSEFAFSMGKVRNHRQILKRNCDALIYKKWCSRYLELSSGYVLVDNLYAFMSLEASLVASALNVHIGLTRAIKSLYLSSSPGQVDESEKIIPLYSILFAYSSSLSLTYLKKSLLEATQKKSIPLNQQVDLICVLDKGLIIKNWEAGGSYLGIETGQDTLMWFYIILMEYLDREGSLQANLRNYVKSGRVYKEF